jgi:arabinofuranosyltransferase
MRHNHGETMRDTALGKMTNRLGKLVLAAFALWCLLFILRASYRAIDGQRYFPLFDDSMISMRYAWNLAHGNGLVWNVGERIEGYSNLLMVLVMSVCTFLFEKRLATLAVQIVGIGILLATVSSVARLSVFLFLDGTQERRQTARLVCLVLACCYYPLAYWSLMGMETGLVALLLSVAVWQAFVLQETGARSSLVFCSASLGLMCLARNDASLFALVIWAYVLVRILWRGRALKNCWKDMALASLWLLFPLAQTIFRWFYYGSLVPNTYVLKLEGMPLLLRLRNGLGFVEPFIASAAVIAGVSLLDLIAHFDSRKLLLFGICAVALAYQVSIGGDPWAYWRLLAPVIPLLLALWARAAFSLMDAARESGFFRAYVVRDADPARHTALSVMTALGLCAGLLLLNSEFYLEALLVVRPYETATAARDINVAIAINELTTPEATVGVFYAGTIPYFTGREAIDFLGRSDAYIAHLPPDISGAVAWSGMTSVPGHNKYDLDYSIRTRLPTYVQFFYWGGQDLNEWALEHYVTVDYQGAVLHLLRDSPDVNWSRAGTP